MNVLCRDRGMESAARVRGCRSRGATDLEFTLAVIFIGLLSATLIARSLILAEKASISSAEAESGSLTTAVALAHSAWVAAGSNPSHSTITLDSTTRVEFNARGWPIGGADDSLSDASECVAIWESLLENREGTRADKLAEYEVSILGSLCIYSPRATSRYGSTLYNTANGKVTRGRPISMPPKTRPDL